jgi:hypothetical protein
MAQELEVLEANTRPPLTHVRDVHALWNAPLGSLPGLAMRPRLLALAEPKPAVAVAINVAEPSHAPIDRIRVIYEPLAHYGTASVSDIARPG